MNPDSRIFVAGHRGLVGSAIARHLESSGFRNLILKTHAEVDLRNQAQTNEFFAAERPDYVFLAAAKVGGILANSTYPAEFIHDNLAIQTNVIDSAYRNGTSKLAFLGSSCIYPRLAPQPIREDYLLTAPLEETNEWYAIAKIAGIKMAQAYRKQYDFNAISIMPTNLYGPGDNFDLQKSHVLPALLRKAHDAKINGAKELVVWGSGTPLREFLHVDDMADACVFLMNHYDDPEIVNVGVGTDVTIRELAEIVKRVTGFEGDLKFDATKPDGTPRKLLDVSRLTGLGWSPRITLEDGIAGTYEWFLANHVAAVA
ncbi:MAG TPA: GDP-L-fucose synthase [Bryobacteraceae bacterium]